jgi:hypothetical protein
MVSSWRAWAEKDPRTRGDDALVIGAVAGVPASAWLLPGPREAGVALLRGCPEDRLHASRPYKVLPPGGAPAARALYGVGLAMAGERVVVFLGAGSTAYGEFHAALHQAHGLPITFVVRWYEGEGPFAPQLAVEPSVVALGIGLTATTVDGTDEAAVREAVASGATVVQANLRGAR